MNMSNSETRKREAESHPVPAQPDTADEALARLVDLIPASMTPDRVADWPSDEQEFFRSGDWNSFVDRGAKLAKMRRVKVAKSILAAGYVPPADMAHWEAKWRVEERERVAVAIEAAVNELPTTRAKSWTGTLGWEAVPLAGVIAAINAARADRATALARQEPTSAEGAGS